MLDHKLYSIEYFADLFYIAVFFKGQPKFNKLDYQCKLDRVYRVSVSNVLKYAKEDTEQKLEYIENAQKAYEAVKADYEASL